MILQLSAFYLDTYAGLNVMTLICMRKLQLSSLLKQSMYTMSRHKCVYIDPWRMSQRLLSGHLPLQMFHRITPTTPLRGSGEARRYRVNKHKVKINICIWMDLTLTRESKLKVRETFHVQPSVCAVISPRGGVPVRPFLCLSQPVSCADTHIRQQQTITLGNHFCCGVKAGANITLGGMFDITTETPSVSNHNKAICSA